MPTNMKAYILQCITNLHAGSGDANYGIVDKLVQRDAVTGYPCIHASSLKGALREHAEATWGKNDAKVLEIFGTDANESNNTKSGSYRFLSAELLALPVRSNYRQFALSFSDRLAELTNQKATLLLSKKIFNKPEGANKLFTDVLPLAGYEIFAEDLKLTPVTYAPPLACKLDGFAAMNSQYAYMNDTDFSVVVESLPVIARNYLVDSTSKNLWYEEVVPHQTLFITYMACTQANTEFEQLLVKETIQIGGNASVGYGLCKFYPVNF